MIKFEMAKKVARGYKPNVDHCEEHEDAFIFSKKGEVSFDNSPVVVLKDGGDVVNMTWYMDNKDYDYPIKEYDF